jgi:hypothetical protein
VTRPLDRGHRRRPPRRAAGQGHRALDAREPQPVLFGALIRRPCAPELPGEKGHAAGRHRPPEKVLGPALHRFHREVESVFRHERPDCPAAIPRALGEKPFGRALGQIDRGDDDVRQEQDELAASLRGGGHDPRLAADGAERLPQRVARFRIRIDDENLHSCSIGDFTTGSG